MTELLSFIWASLSSPHGLCVAVIFMLMVWTSVGVQRFRARREDRAQIAELNQMIAEMPAAPRPEKTLFPSMQKDPRHAA